MIKQNFVLTKMEERDTLLEAFEKDPKSLDKMLVRVLLKKYKFDPTILIRLTEESLEDQVDFDSEDKDFVVDLYEGILSIFPKKNSVKKYIEDVFINDKNMAYALNNIRNKVYIGKNVNVRDLVEKRETLKEKKRKRTSVKDFENSVEAFFENLLFSEEMENEILFRTT
jgi:hypothetical protein